MLALAYSNQSQLDMLRDRNDEAIESSTRAIALARAHGDPATLSHALCNLGTAQLQRGIEDGTAALQESLAVALAAQEQEHACRAYVNTIWLRLEHRELAAAMTLLTPALKLAQDSEQIVFRDYLLVERARVELAEGRYDDAVSSVQSALASPGAVRCAALIVLNLALVRIGGGRGWAAG